MAQSVRVQFEFAGIEEKARTLHSRGLFEERWNLSVSFIVFERHQGADSCSRPVLGLRSEKRKSPMRVNSPELECVIIREVLSASAWADRGISREGERNKQRRESWEG